jgi:putative ABC transport system substrate-binding protein
MFGLHCSCGAQTVQPASAPRTTPARDSPVVRLTRLAAPSRPKRSGQAGDSAVDRRAFIGALAGTVMAAPLAAQAQQAGKVWRIGFVGAETPSINGHFLTAFRQGMRELGYVEPQSMTVEDRWAEGRSEQFQGLIAELIRLKVDVLVPLSTRGGLAAKHLTTTIPIVFVATDPIGTGLVSSLDRPGGNLTGLSITLGDEFAGKWLELLREINRRLSRVAVLGNPTNPANAVYLKAAEVSAQRLGTKLQFQGVTEPKQFEGAFRSMATARAEGLIVFIDPLTVRYRGQIVELAARARLPAIYGFREFVDAGGLMAYGSNVAVLCRRAAVYVDKILRGAKPGDLPVEQATQFELVINLRTAKALGLTIPRSLLQRADQVIE